MKFNYDYNSRFRILKGGKISLVVSALVASVSLLHASPSGGVVTAGSASIAQSGSVTNITQSTPKASINWQNFSIGTNEAVTFNQPSTSSITLNRVVGNEKSIIDGALNANGQVWILNANGLLFSKNASINTAGLVATTMNLSDADFQAGNYAFKGDSSASIINQGTINISDKGYAALFGAEVRNEGIIKATLGKVALTGAKEVSLNLNGNSMVSLTVNKGVLDALVENKGAIYADGGEVYLTTNAVDELLRGVVNNTGIVEANSIDDITGKIELYAHGGALHVEGTLEAKNGFIETSGKAFSVADETIVKAKTWLIDPTDITISDASTYNNTLNGGTDVTITTDGYIRLGSPISKTSGTDATLTLKAGGDILIYSNITSTSSKLNTVLWADADGNGEGRIEIGTVGMSAAINTNGGHLWIGGGSIGTATWHELSVGDGAATSASIHGVMLNPSSSLTSAGGDIFIKGAYTGTLDNVRGVDLEHSSISSGIGNIEISGTNSAIGTYNYGINSVSSITSTTGSITLTGTTASDSAYGISLGSPISSSSGDIALNTDRLYLSGGATLTSTGKLTIAPTTAGTTIGIGSGSGTLSLPSSYFSTNFHNGFSGITIGSATAGTINIDGSTTYNDTLTLKTASDIMMDYLATLTGGANESASLVLWADADGSGEGRIEIGSGGGLGPISINTNGGHLWIGGGSIGTATWHGLSVGDGAATSASHHGVMLDSDSFLTSSGGDIFIKGSYTGTTNNFDGVVSYPSSFISSGIGNIEIYGTNSGTGATNHGIYSSSSITSTTGSITLTGTTASDSAYGIDLRSSISSDSGDIALNANRLNLGGSVPLASAGKLTIAPTTAGTTIGIDTGSGTLSLPNSYFSTNFHNGFSGITIGSATAGTITINGTTTYNDTLTLKTAGDIVMNGGTLTGGAGESASLVLWANADGNGEGRVEIGPGTINTNGGNLWIGGGSGTATWNGLSVGDGAATTSSMYSGVFLNDSSINSGAGNIEISGTNSATGANKYGIKSTASTTGSIISTTGSITLTGTTDSSSAYGISLGGPISSDSGDITLSADRLKLETSNATLSTGTGTITLRSDEFVNATGLIAPFSAALTNIYLPSYTDATLNGLTVDDKRYNTTYAGGCLSAGCTLPTTGVNLLYAEAPVLTVSPTSGQTSTYGDSFSASGYALSGFVDGDDVASSGISGTAVYTLGGTQSGSGHWVAGSHDIAYSSGLASQLGYTFADDTSVNNELSIAKRPVNISVAKNYNGNADFTTGFTLGNIVSGETVSINSGSATVSSANTGSYTSFTANTLSLSDANNYTLTGGSVSATIFPALGPTPEELAAIEAARLAAIEAERIAAEQEAARLATIEAERLAAEAARLAAIEAARLEAERLAAIEAARVEAERLAAIEAARVEAERLAAIEAARVEAERLAAIEAARIEAERLAAIEAARITAEAQTIATQIVNGTAMKPPVLPTFTSPNTSLFQFSNNGQTYDVFLQPIAGIETQEMSLQELSHLMGSSGRGVGIPLLQGLLLHFSQGGLNLPDGVEQVFYIAQR